MQSILLLLTLSVCAFAQQSQTSITPSAEIPLTAEEGKELDAFQETAQAQATLRKLLTDELAASDKALLKARNDKERTEIAKHRQTSLLSNATLEKAITAFQQDVVAWLKRVRTRANCPTCEFQESARQLVRPPEKK